MRSGAARIRLAGCLPWRLIDGGGSSNRLLAAKNIAELSVPRDEIRITRFINDNLFIQLGASVRSRRIYIVQSLT